MAQQKFTSIVVAAYLSGSWTALDVHQPSAISADWGMAGGQALDRLAKTGWMTFSLNNATGQYSPNSTNALAGWGLGVAVRITYTYAGSANVRFRGYVSEIDIAPGTKKSRLVRVTVLDWMDYAINHPVLTPTFAQNRTADYGISSLLENMPVQPQGTDLDNGISTFLTLFDTTTTKTKAYSEFNKFAMGEFGYIYLKKDKVNGETLVFENRYARGGTRTPTPVPLVPASCGLALNEDGGYELNEDGSFVILDETTTYTADNTMIGIVPKYGKQITNYVTARAFPKKIDTSLHVLFTLSSPILIGKGETNIFRASYSDPTGGAQVNAIPSTCVQPVITTDYLMFVNEDGTGTNLSANLTATATYGVEGVTYSLYNSGDSGYVTFLQARGYGIYSYNPIEQSQSSIPSYTAYGYRTMDIEQLMQQNLILGYAEAAKIVDLDKNPRTVPETVTFVANSNVFYMQAFMNMDVGDMTDLITEDISGINGYYYICGMFFTTDENGNTTFGWRLKEAFSLNYGTNLIGVECNASGDGVNYGYLPHAANLTQKSYSAWILGKGNNGGENVIMGNYVSLGGGNIGNKFSVTNSGYLTYLDGGATSGDYGQWRNQTIDCTLGLHHVVVTRDVSSIANLPNFYIDGVLVPLTTIQSQASTYTESGLVFTCGNESDWNAPFAQILRDARLYNRILSPAEITTLYTEGIGGLSVADGLVFQGPTVRTNDISSYAGATINYESKLLENIHNTVGTPHAAPITQFGLGNVFSKIGNATATATWTHYGIQNAPNRLLVVEISLRATETISSVTFGSQSLTFKSAKSFGSGSSDPRVELWYLLAPAVGSDTVTVTASSASFLHCASIDFANVSQSTPFGTVDLRSGTGGTPTSTVAGAVGDFVIDIIGVATGTITADSSQYPLWSATSDGSWRGGGSMEPGAASVSMTWALGGANKWALLGVAVKKA